MEINLQDALVDRAVERLFKQSPPVYDQICINPVTGARYVGGFDPVGKQKDWARRALRAREWFKVNGPTDLQPLPVSFDEREGLMGKGSLLAHILKWYARSLEAREYDFNEHPPFADYVSGVLWEAQLPEGGFVSLPNYGPEQLQALKKRFAPKMLKGMSPGAYWLPPKPHAEEIASCRRSSAKPDKYFLRE